MLNDEKLNEELLSKIMIVANNNVSGLLVSSLASYGVKNS